MVCKVEGHVFGFQQGFAVEGVVVLVRYMGLGRVMGLGVM